MWPEGFGTRVRLRRDLDSGAMPEMTEYPDVGLYIGGSWRTTVDDLPVVNPANEQVIGRLSCAGPQDLDDALEAAAKGFRVWSQTAPKDRADVLRRAAAIMRERRVQIGHDITLELGKPYQQAKLEVIRGCEFFEWDAGEAVRTYGRVIPSGPGINYTVHQQPIGPVAAFSPWNFPMSQPARKVAGRSGCGMLDHPQTRRGDTGGARCTSCRPSTTRASRPACSTWCGGVPSEISEHLIPHEAIRLVAFHGFDGGWPAPHRAGLGPHDIGPDGTRRSRTGDRVRGHRREGGRGHLSGAKDAQCRAGLHVTDPVLRPRQASSRSSSTPSPSGPRPRWWATVWAPEWRWGRWPTTAASQR